MTTTITRDQIHDEIPLRRGARRRERDVCGSARAQSLCSTRSSTSTPPSDPARFRMLTGDRPTGPLHIGHYLASLRNRVRLQDKGVETFVVIADYQVITDRDSVGEIGANVHGLVLDYLAAGLDPERSTIFTHSAVPGPEPADAALPVARHRRRAAAQPDRQGRARPLRRAPPVRAAPHLPGAPGRRHPLLPQPDRARRPRPAAAPRADPGHRAPLQPEVCRRAQCVRRARGAAQRRPAAARHRRHEDEQEQGQRHQPARHARTRLRPGSAAARTDSRAANHLRAHRASRGGQPADASPALFLDEAPESIADGIGDGGARQLKEVVTEAVNESPAPGTGRAGPSSRATRHTSRRCSTRGTPGRTRWPSGRSRRFGPSWGWPTNPIE